MLISATLRANFVFLSNMENQTVKITSPKATIHSAPRALTVAGSVSKKGEKGAIFLFKQYLA